MAAGVIVKRIAAIENFGSMDVLCTDKTGTLTEGVVRVHATSIRGPTIAQVLLYAYLNASIKRVDNPWIEAIREAPVGRRTTTKRSTRFPTIYPQTTERARRKVAAHILITKGALENILLEVCTNRSKLWRSLPARHHPGSIEHRCRALSAKGSASSGWLTVKRTPKSNHASRRERFHFRRLFAIFRPAEPDRAHNRRLLARRGVALKIITGDKYRGHVAEAVCQPGAHRKGPARDERRGAAPPPSEVDVFAEVEPNQKERIILALQKAGTSSATWATASTTRPRSTPPTWDLGRQRGGRRAGGGRHRAAREGPRVLVAGMREGRRTFANTLKYVFMATSANFGNMFSMAGASLFLPVPAAGPEADPAHELADRPSRDDHRQRQRGPRDGGTPRRWDIRFIRRFMMVFGLVSSIFDYLTFGALLLFCTPPPAIPTGWFIESVISAALIVLVVRSRRPFFSSRPSKLLALATVAIVCVTAVTPYLPLAGVLGFQPLPMYFYLVLGLVVMGYVVIAELAKSFFYRLEKGANRRKPMIKDLISAATTTLIACAALQPGNAAAAEESAANQFMHQADFDQLAARFEDPARAEWQKPEKVIASLGPLEGKTVVDIGAGTGYFSFPISKQAAKVIAIDIDQRFLDYIAQKTTDANKSAPTSRPV